MQDCGAVGATLLWTRCYCGRGSAVGEVRDILNLRPRIIEKVYFVGVYILVKIIRPINLLNIIFRWRIEGSLGARVIKTEYAQGI